MNFRHDQSRQVFVVGSGTVDTLPDELGRLEVRTVALVGSSRALASAAGTAVRRALSGLKILHEFDGVAPHAPIADTERMAGSIGGDAPDAFVAVGGGSASDTAKALAILLAEGGPLAERCSTFTPPDQLHHVELRRPKLPVISVPTTFSGAEITPGGGATTADGIKRVFWDPQVACRVVLFDSAVLAATPVELLTTTGMNGLAHCAEALYSKTANPFSDALAAEGARRFAATLPTLAAGGGDASVLDEASTAACIGGLVIANARVGLHHAICHVLGAAFGVPHGVANSVMLPYVLDFNHDVTEEPQRRLSAALAAGLDADPGSSAAVLVAEVQRRAQVPSRLSEVGLDRDALPTVARDVMQDRGLFFNPKRITDAAQVQAVLERAWNGDVAGRR